MEEVVKADLKTLNLTKEMTKDHDNWQDAVLEKTHPTHASMEGQA